MIGLINKKQGMHEETNKNKAKQLLFNLAELVLTGIVFAVFASLLSTCILTRHEEREKQEFQL